MIGVAPAPEKKLENAEVLRFQDIVVVGITTEAFAEGLWMSRRQALRFGKQLLREAVRR